MLIVASLQIVCCFVLAYQMFDYQQPVLKSFIRRVALFEKFAGRFY